MIGGGERRVPGAGQDGDEFGRDAHGPVGLDVQAARDREGQDAIVVVDMLDGQGPAVFPEGEDGLEMFEARPLGGHGGKGPPGLGGRGRDGPRDRGQGRVAPGGGQGGLVHRTQHLGLDHAPRQKRHLPHHVGKFHIIPLDRAGRSCPVASPATTR